MTELRNKTIENVINAVHASKIEVIIRDSVETLKKNNTHHFIIIRFLTKMEMKLREIMVAPALNNKVENIYEALKCINNHEINISKFDPK